MRAIRIFGKSATLVRVDMEGVECGHRDQGTPKNMSYILILRRDNQCPQFPTGYEAITFALPA